MEFSSGFQPSPHIDPNANRVFQPNPMGAGPNGMCLFPLPNGQFVNQSAFFSFPQPLQPTAIQSSNGTSNSMGKDIKDESSGSPGHEDLYMPPSESNGSVVLQAL
jgi:hypothetical protein